MTFDSQRFALSLVGVAVIAVGWQLLKQTPVVTLPARAEVNDKALPKTDAQVATQDLAALSREIDRTIDESDTARARWGVSVISMTDGRVLYARNADSRFTPASNMKIFTTAVALDLLGAGYRWRTSVYAEKQMGEGGVIDGDLVLYGRGAPDLDSKDGLPALADQLYARGLRHVRGNVIGDESYFRGDRYGTGWQWNDLQWYFGAPPSALSIDENSFEIMIAAGKKQGTPADVRLTPNDGYVRLTNNTTTAERDRVASVGIERELSSNDVRVWGDFPVSGRSFSAFLSVNDPALRAAKLFRQQLVTRGVQIDGEARGRDFRLGETEKFDPQKAFELAFLESKPLGDIVRKTNKESNNLYAELTLRTIGKERRPPVPDAERRKRRERGDDEAGTEVVTSWLASHDIPESSVAIVDGSGLSRLDLVTPDATARLLLAISRSGVATVFRESLPIAGKDGTLNGRLINTAQRVVAKTGSLTFDHSLSGYVRTKSNELLAFSIFCNDATGSSHPVRTIDAIATLLADFDASEPSKPAQK